MVIERLAGHKGSALGFCSGVIAGLVAVTDGGLVTDRGVPPDTPALPPGAGEVVVSEDGQVGVLVEDGRDGTVLLVWGRDLPRGDRD